jgi:hypothetical protein
MQRTRKSEHEGHEGKRRRSPRVNNFVTAAAIFVPFVFALALQLVANEKAARQ